MDHARRSKRLYLATAFLVTVGVVPHVPAQTPGQNINMVSGRVWPGGDPFLQRQNEPSLAVSSRNERHLLAGANDYRSVNIPFPDPVPGSLAGDAWLGVFKSFDGGQTWQSTLLPGYPQDNSPQGLASPLKGFSAAADPTVRFGTHGIAYYSGIAFNRGTDLGVVFVSRFIDLNNKENGNVVQGTDPMPYLDTMVVDSGTSGQFLDKTWIATDIPRAGAGTCTITVNNTTQTVPAGNVYFVWSRFTGNGGTKIMFSRSLNCGASWTTPIKLSESNSVNQGTVLAVDPVSGAVYAAWRRFKTSSEPDAILFATSTDFGKTFGKAKEITSILPFDQPTTPYSFRTNALPTIAVSVDASNHSRVHVAWAARPVPDGDSRIHMATSSNGGASWEIEAVDNAPLMDDEGNTFTRGHQFMPALTFTAGRLMLLYYDSRLDHTIGTYTPNSTAECAFCPDENGNFYKEARTPWGELPGNPGAVFTSFLSDQGLTLRRHTLDLRVGQAAAGPLPRFNSTRVSQYVFGLASEGDTVLQQLKVNPPNLPMFQGGMLSFIGDYIDIAGQMFVTQSDGSWRFNTAPSAGAMHYATWTSNEDVRPPADRNWSNYTPPGPGCVPGQEAIRNQNIYSSRITQGLLVSSPQNSKPLSPTVQRAFVVLVQNATDLAKSFRLTIANQPAQGWASFLQAPSPIPALNLLPPPTTTLDVEIPAHSAIARSVYALSTNPVDRITVNVAEVPEGLASFVVLNADSTVPALANPDGFSGPDIAQFEIYNPNISNPNISNPNISNPNISNPNVSNPNISNPNISNPNISNLDIADPNVSNPNISNASVANPNISNPNISNPNISNQTISDVSYTVTNVGNTSGSYTINLLGNVPPNTTSLQLIVNKPYLTPTFGLGNQTCQLVEQSQNVLLTNITAPVFRSLSDYTNPNISNPNISNATFLLAPGESAVVTLRATLDTSAATQSANALAPENQPPMPTEDLSATAGPAVVSQAINSGAQTNPVAVALLILTTSLPEGKVGAAYDQPLQAVGGTTPYTWSLDSGDLADFGLGVVPDGRITGVPSKIGTAVFTVRATDSSSPDPRTNTRLLSLTIIKGDSVTTILSDNPEPSVVGQPVTVVFSVEPSTPVAPTGTVTVTDGTGASCEAVLPATSCVLTPTTAGLKTLTASYPGDTNFNGSSDTEPHQVNKADTTTTITADLPDPSVVGQAYTVTWTVTAAPPGAGTPTGTVTVNDGSGASCSASVSAGSCTLTSTVAGIKTLTAAYGGDSNFNSSSDTESHQVVYNFLGFFSPMNVAGTCAALTSSGVQKLGNALPIKWQLLDAQGIAILNLGTIVRLEAAQGTSCEGTRILLFSPTAGAKGGSEMRVSSGQYIFNWNTGDGTAAGRYVIVLTLADGSVRASTIQLKP